MTKLYSEKKKLTFPNELYEYLVRQVNNALDEKFISISFPIVEIKFYKYRRKGSAKTVEWLFEDLSKRLAIISQKYNLDLAESSHRKDIMIDFEERDKLSTIKITGYHFIPLKSFGNMLSIIVWSYIVFTLGKKPSEDEEAKLLHKKYTVVFENFKTHWNRMSRKRIPITEERSCFICGKPAYSYNKWIYKAKEGKEEVITPVCKTHKNRLI